ncbi:MAG: mechanosensitive ion channel family protein [Acidobacteriota bacterium]|nr:mechanosensitive ion channel family protein [Acidobacteriota bacterium]
MKVFLRYLIDDPFTALIPIGVFIATILAALLVRRILFRAVKGWAERTESHLDVLVTESLHGPIVLWAIILGVHLALDSSKLPSKYHHDVHIALEALWVLSLTVAAARFAGNAVRFYGGRVTGAQSVTSLTQKLTQLVVVGLGIVWILKVVFDMSLTPLITAFGVGGLAVALALQDTLSNLFAGFYVSISRLVRIGDYIKLSSGEEGYVTDINWRCTTMRTGANNLVVIPNNKLGTSIYTNYYLPEPRLAMSVQFGVGVDEDIDRVAAILQDEALAAAAEINGILTDPGPSVLFSPGPADWSNIFQVNFSVPTYVDQFLAQSELRKRIYKRLLKEEISLPYPTKSVIVENRQSAAS